MPNKKKRIRYSGIKNIIEEYRYKNDIKEPKCISDTILLYTRWGMERVLAVRYYSWYNFHYVEGGNIEEDKKTIGDNMDDEQKQRFNDNIMKIYHLIRGEPVYTAKIPFIVAASILYIASVKSGLNVTQKDIVDIFGIADVSLRNTYKQIEKDFNIYADLKK